MDELIQLDWSHDLLRVQPTGSPPSHPNNDTSYFTLASTNHSTWPSCQKPHPNANMADLTAVVGFASCVSSEDGGHLRNCTFSDCWQTLLLNCCLLPFKQLLDLSSCKINFPLSILSRQQILSAFLLFVLWHPKLLRWPCSPVFYSLLCDLCLITLALWYLKGGIHKNNRIWHVLFYFEYCFCFETFFWNKPVDADNPWLTHKTIDTAI